MVGELSKAVLGFQGCTEGGLQGFQETPLDFTHYLKHYFIYFYLFIIVFST